MPAVVVRLDGVDVTDDVVFAKTVFRCLADGQPGPATVVIKDEDQAYGPSDIRAGMTLELLVDGTREWDGWVFGVRQGWHFPAQDTAQPLEVPRAWTLVGADRNVLFQKRVMHRVDDPSDNQGFRIWDTDTSDRTAIDYANANYVDLTGDGLDVDSGIEQVGSPGPFEEFTLGYVSAPWGVLFDDAAKITGAVFYIDPDRVVRYVDDMTVTAPFVLSDAPTGGQVGYRDVDAAKDYTDAATQALVWGAGKGSSDPVFAKYTDQDARDLHGLWQWGEVYVGAWKQQTVDRRARTYVLGSPEHRRGHNDPVPVVTCTIFEPGIRVGHVVDFRATLFAYQQDLPVRSSTITFLTPDQPQWELEMTPRVDAPFGVPDPWRLPPFDISETIPPEGPGGLPDADPGTIGPLIDHFIRTPQWWSKEVIRTFLFPEPDPWAEGVPLPVVPGGVRFGDVILIVSIADPFGGDGSSGQPTYDLEPDAEFGPFAFEDVVADVMLIKSGGVTVFRHIVDGTEPGFPDLLIYTQGNSVAQAAVYVAREAEAVAIDGGPPEEAFNGHMRLHTQNLHLDFLEPGDYPDDGEVGLMAIGYRGFSGDDPTVISAGHLTGVLNKWNGSAYVPDLGWSIDHSRLLGIREDFFLDKGAYLIATRRHDLPLGGGFEQFREIVDLWPYPENHNLGATVAVGLLPGPIGIVPVGNSQYQSGNPYGVNDPDDFVRVGSSITTTTSDEAAVMVRDYLRLVENGEVTDPTPWLYPTHAWSFPGRLRFKFSFTGSGANRGGYIQITWWLVGDASTSVADVALYWYEDGGDVTDLFVSGTGGSESASPPLSAGVEYYLDILHAEDFVRAKVWPVGDAEPGWQASVGGGFVAATGENSNAVRIAWQSSFATTSIDAWWSVAGSGPGHVVTTPVPIYDNAENTEAATYVTSYPYAPGSLVVYFEGTRMRPNVDFIETDPASGEFRITGGRDVSSSLLVKYRRAGSQPTSGGGGSVYRPAPQMQYGWGTPLDGYNCTFACSAMALDRHTEGQYTAFVGTPRSTPPNHRGFQSDQMGGGDLSDVADAWDNGWGKTFHGHGTHGWDTFEENVSSGRGAILQGVYAELPASKRFSNFSGGHALYVNERFSNGNYLGMDPLYRYPIVYTEAELRAYAAALAGTGSVSAGYTGVTT